MTFEKILNDLTFNAIDTKQASEEITKKDKMKRIMYYAHIENITKEPLKDGQLQELNAIVGVLQILYNSALGSPVNDFTYDTLQEMLVDLGIPRLSGSAEINSASKLEHTYKNLRGTLSKIYYLFPDEKRTNKSRKYLHEWIKSTESLYEKATGNKIDLRKVKIMVQPKFDGCLPARTNILLSDGRIITIGEIVDEQLDVEVLSYNPSTHVLESRRVINWYRYENDKSTRWVKIHVGPKNRINHWKKPYSSGTTIYPSDNHHMLVLDESSGNMIDKTAMDIKVGDTLCSPKFVLSNIQDQIIRGSILEMDTNVVTSVEFVNTSTATNHKKQQYRYDLEVEGNHNYFANGLLVHNCSAVRENDGKRKTWISRGDTRINKASDVSHIMNIFDGLWNEEICGMKFEVMMTEENKNTINELYRTRHYKNSRQIVTAVINSNEADFKAEYLYPIPLRIMHEGDEIEQIHPELIEKFPTIICTFGDLDKIKEFSNDNRWISINGMRLRTDGAVLTILDPTLQKILGRTNDINNFEVAYKFTEEVAYTKVKDIEFPISEFGYITPRLVVNDVIMKGNTVNRISLSNRERFDELDFSYGDGVKILYDIIPYATIDEKCQRVKNGRKIEFIKECPCCHSKLDLTEIQVQCKNPDCSFRIVGKILNYCANLRIQNIGFSTLDMLYSAGLLKNGIRSLYKLKKKTYEIEEIDGFGKLKTRKIIAEIEAKRRLNDSDFFGSIGIEGLSIKTFESIFAAIPYTTFLDMIKLKNFDLLFAKLIAIDGIAEKKAEALISYLKDIKKRIEILKLIEVLSIIETFQQNKVPSKGRIVFTGCRPSDELVNILKDHNWDPSASWSKQAKYLVIPQDGYESDKVTSAIGLGIPIIVLNGRDPIDVIKKAIPDLL